MIDIMSATMATTEMIEIHTVLVKTPTTTVTITKTKGTTNTTANNRTSTKTGATTLRSRRVYSQRGIIRNTSRTTTRCKKPNLIVMSAITDTILELI